VPLASLPGSSEGAWLPVPSVFVVGRDGIVRFAHSDPDFKVRLAPAAVLAAVKP
jgi:peroxiredoxin